MGNNSDKGSKSGNVVSNKEILGTKSVAVSNRFDLLREDIVNVESDPWKEVKELVIFACSTTGVPIADNILKGWTDDMIKFYKVKWNNRPRSNVSAKQHFENEMKSLSYQILQINRNLDKNSKMNAEKMLKLSSLTTPVKSDASFSKFYDEAYRAELAKIAELQKEKNLFVVELFLLLNKPLDKDRNDMWTDDMLDYYSSRCEDIKSDHINGHGNDMGESNSVVEVEEEDSGSALFMAQIGGAFASHPSSVQC